MKTLYVGVNKNNDLLELIAQEGNRWYFVRVLDGSTEWAQCEKPGFELTPIRDIPTPPRQLKEG